MIDCAKSGNYGCEGGDICLLLNWLVKSDTRVQFDSSYPIQLIDGPCKIKNTTDGIKVKDYTCNRYLFMLVLCNLSTVPSTYIRNHTYNFYFVSYVKTYFHY